MKKSDLILLIPYLLTLISFLGWMLCMERAGQKVKQDAEALIEQFNNSEIHIVNVQNMNQPVIISSQGTKRLHVEGVLKYPAPLPDSLENSPEGDVLNVEGGVDRWASTKTDGQEYIEGHMFTSQDYKEKRKLNLKEGIRISNDTLYLDGTKYTTYGSIRITHPGIRDVVGRNNSVEVVFRRPEVIDGEHPVVMDEQPSECQMKED